MSSLNFWCQICPQQCHLKLWLLLLPWEFPLCWVHDSLCSAFSFLLPVISQNSLYIVSPQPLMICTCLSHVFFIWNSSASSLVFGVNIVRSNIIGWDEALVRFCTMNKIACLGIPWNTVLMCTYVVLSGQMESLMFGSLLLRFTFILHKTPEYFVSVWSHSSPWSAFFADLPWAQPSRTCFPVWVSPSPAEWLGDFPDVLGFVYN